MTTDALAKAYLTKARFRIKMLELALAESAFSDAVREAQELVELATKGMLRAVGVEPPKWHDVGKLPHLRPGRGYPALRVCSLTALASMRP